MPSIKLLPFGLYNSGVEIFNPAFCKSIFLRSDKGNIPSSHFLFVLDDKIKTVITEQMVRMIFFIVYIY